ncbi:MAG: flagellar basal body rod protein FlgC [Deltaproteobacteria bacterium]|nr:flagellar basal body rod protein FlgC [Deltaproteobacteria bacterium]MBW1960796.1 flagellar basal body rod protein FlgC [Deltaproteobacteria bacterium]MBW1995070.1 flagellar basal body rod protein FlgC [Deltaproteobacteria bacterium]MBW2151753.1 flagellar basal body rod protein FlgC [Deltaproteobacteria bacterium]
MDLLNALRISATGLAAQRIKMNVVAENLANIETSRTQQGGPYRRKMVVLSEKPRERFRDALGRLQKKATGVEVTEVLASQQDYRLVYNPSHPDADPETGYVAMPNINLLTEMADMMVARRAYDAGIAAIANTRSMILKALEIGK